MGVPSKTQVESWTDQVAAIIQKDITGFENEYASKSALQLADLVDQSADSYVVGALTSGALDIDTMSLPENASSYLASITARSPLRTWAQALSSLVVGVNGGSYASLRAYLSDKSAQVHPLFGELARAVQGETAFAETDGTIITVFTPNYQVRAADRVWTGADGSLVERTSAASDATTADLPLFASNNHAVYVGSRYKFTTLVTALSTVASATITPTFQYWNGNAWVTLTVTDNSTGFSKNDLITWTAPADWSRGYLDGGATAFASAAKERLYYIRIARTASSLTTPPTGTCMRIVPAMIPTVPVTGTAHLGMDQPPLALIRITGVNTCVVTAPVNVDYTRFKPPAVSLRALTPFANNVTVTLGYNNQAGSALTQAQSAWTTPAALDTVAVTLNGADTGVRSVSTSTTTVVTAATSGVIAVYAAALRTPAI